MISRVVWLNSILMFRAPASSAATRRRRDVWQGYGPGDVAVDLGRCGKAGHESTPVTLPHRAPLVGGRGA
jgi:hypothetical protein